MTPDQLYARYPPGMRVQRLGRLGGLGTVTGVAFMVGGPVVYVTWDAPRAREGGEEVVWREAVAASSVIPMQCRPLRTPEEIADRLRRAAAASDGLPPWT